MRQWLTFAIAVLAAAPAMAVECRDLTHDGNRFSICEANTAEDEIHLFLRGPDGTLYGHFHSLEATLNKQGKTLPFAMNGGMYHDDRRPVGHFLESGREVQRLITSAGPGNFGLLPNGVFCIRDGRADVFETLRFERTKPNCRDATQSGPMLVIDGELHPRFLKDSTSRYIRNGVGTSGDGQRVVFAISNNAVTFHEFGRLFRDVLKVPQALYFDGNVSRLHARPLNRSDPGFRMGPIVGIVAPD